MASLQSIDNLVLFSIARGIDIPLALDDCTIKKILGFYVLVFGDMNMLFSL